MNHADQSCFTHLEVNAGSRAYGFTTPESDTDIRGVKWHGSLSNLLGLNKQIDNKEGPKEEDIVHFSFREFVHLLSFKTSFTQLDLLFTSEKDILQIDEWGQLLIDKRNSFLSKTGILNSCRGFAKGQYHFVMRNKPEARAEREGTITLPVYDKQYRKAQHHSIRTLWQALTCFQTGHWPVRVKDYDSDAHNLLMNIKLNAMPYEEWEILFKDYLAKVEQAYDASSLPEKVDKQYWDNIVINYHLSLIKKLKGNNETLLYF